MCWKCGAEQDFSHSVYRSSTCASCGADLHSCRGCAFYAPGSHFDCHETVDEIVTEKERANFCEHFKAGRNSKWSGVQGQNGAQDKNAAARDAFNSLFG